MTGMTEERGGPVRGALYLVPTPIGNLEDITLRALRVLRECDLVVCEDTRQTAKLLHHFEIRKPLISFYTYNQMRRLPQLIAELKAGRTIAVVSDSGMPGISDPGALLVTEAVGQGFPVSALPGPSAVVTAMAASGLPSDGFVFLGFLRRKPGKMKKELRGAGAVGKTVIFYESPHRIRKTISVCAEVFGPAARAVLARELSKKFEEYIRGTLRDIGERLAASEVRGEMVVLISPAAETQGQEDTEEEREGDQD